MTYNKSHPEYSVGTKAYLGTLRRANTGLTVTIDYEEVIIVKGSLDCKPEYKNIVTYCSEGTNKPYTSSSHWSYISTNKFDLIYKFVGHAINWSQKHNDSLDYLVEANKKTEHFKEAFNLYIDLNAEMFV